MALRTKKQGKELTGNTQGTRTTVISEEASLPVYHIVKKNNLYYVYSPELVLKGKFASEKEAIAYIRDNNEKTRLPICIQNEQGVIIGTRKINRTKRLLRTDTEKLKTNKKNKKVRKIYAH